jgi:hypothetical protein
MQIRRTAVLLAAMLGAILVAAPAHAQSLCQGNDPPSYCFGPTGSSPTGGVTGISRVPAGLSVRGWAQDPDADTTTVTVTLNGTAIGSIPTTAPDGTFQAVLPVTSAGSTVCVTAVNVGPGANRSLGCRTVTVGVDPFGNTDSFAYVHWVGWVIDPDSAAPLQVYAVINGITYGPWTADRSRPDVAAAYPGYGANHGFDITAPPFPPPSVGADSGYLYAVNVATGQNTAIAGSLWLS